MFYGSCAQLFLLLLCRSCPHQPQFCAFMPSFLISLTVWRDMPVYSVNLCKALSTGVCRCPSRDSFSATLTILYIISLDWKWIFYVLISDNNVCFNIWPIYLWSLTRLTNNSFLTKKRNSWCCVIRVLAFHLRYSSWPWVFFLITHNMLARK